MMKCKFIIVVFLLSYYVVTAGTLTVVNGQATAYTTSTMSFPSGVTRLGMASSPASLLSGLSGDFGITIPTDTDTTVYISPAGVISAASGEPNMWIPFGAGMGVGFTFFGFGWILRLTKKIPEF